MSYQHGLTMWQSIVIAVMIATTYYLTAHYYRGTYKSPSWMALIVILIISYLVGAALMTSKEGYSVNIRPVNDVSKGSSEGSSGSCGMDEAGGIHDGIHKGTHVCKATGRKLLPLMEPEFNIREATKNMILLEDHLFHDDRRCVDCVRKHCLTIEAFLDEAFSLDKKGKYTILLEEVSTEFGEVSHAILKCTNDGLEGGKCMVLAQRLRVVRKRLMQVVATFD